MTGSPHNRLVRLAVFVLSTAVLPCAALADDWCGFQNGGNPVRTAGDYPTEWSPESSITWETQLAGYGQSSPVISDGLVFVTSLSGDRKETLHVEAFNLKNGKRAWRYDTKNSSPQKKTNYVSKAAPSPVCDSEGVVAFFEGGDVVALARDGALRWKRNLVADYGPIDSRHGLGASLEHDDEKVFVWVERSTDPYVLALVKDSGRTLWKSEGLGKTSWSSPRLVPVNEAAHLVLSGIGGLAGFDPQTGERLWDFEDISGNSTPTPLPVGDGRFLIGATVGRGESGGGNAAASNGLIQITGSAEQGFSAAYVWQASRATSSFGSPIAHNGFAWFVNRAGVVYCLDLKTGEEIYANRTADSIWATPLAIKDRLYLPGKDGTTTIIRAADEYEAVAENALWKPDKTNEEAGHFGGPVLYAIAAADSTLLLRRGTRLYGVSTSSPRNH